jgi:phosphoenolpyruvate synthase/pyruvate phosphate dikinase
MFTESFPIKERKTTNDLLTQAALAVFEQMRKNMGHSQESNTTSELAKEIAKYPIITTKEFKEWSKKYSKEELESELIRVMGNKCMQSLFLDANSSTNVPKFAILTTQFFDELIGEAIKSIREVFKSTKDTGTLHPQYLYRPEIYEVISKALQQKIMEQPVPERLQLSLMKAFKYVSNNGENDVMARSSALTEDGGSGKKPALEDLAKIQNTEDRIKEYILGCIGGAFAGVGASIPTERESSQEKIVKIVQAVCGSLFSSAGIADRMRAYDQTGRNPNPGDIDNPEKMPILLQEFIYPRNHKELSDQKLLLRVACAYIYGNKGIKDYTILESNPEYKEEFAVMTVAWGTGSTIADNKCRTQTVFVNRQIMFNQDQYDMNLIPEQNDEIQTKYYVTNNLTKEKTLYTVIDHPKQDKATLFDTTTKDDTDIESASKKYVYLPENFPDISLNMSLVKSLIEKAVFMEREYEGRNMDTEYALLWSNDSDSSKDSPAIYDLQARAVTGATNEKLVIKEPFPQIPVELKQYVCYGTNEYSKGVAFPATFFTREYLANNPDLDTDQPLVLGAEDITAHDADLYNLPGVAKSGGLATKTEGGVTSHPAAKSSEMGIPYVPGLENFYDQLEPGKKYMLVGYGFPKPFIMEYNDTTKEYIQHVVKWHEEVKANSWSYKEHKETLPLKVIKFGVNITTPESAEKKGLQGLGYESVPLLRLFDYYNSNKQCKEFDFLNPYDNSKARNEIIYSTARHIISLVRSNNMDNWKSFCIRNTAPMLKEFPGNTSTKQFQDIIDTYGDSKFGVLQGAAFTEAYPGLYEMEMEAILLAQKYLKNVNSKCQLKFMIEFPTSARQVNHLLNIAIKKGFRDEGIKIGTMIESLRIIDEIKQIQPDLLDFVSFGTNDLGQQLFGTRQGLNSAKLRINASNQESLARCVVRACSELHALNPDIHMSLCGEFINLHPELLPVFLQAGVTEFAVSSDPEKMSDLHVRSLILEQYHYDKKSGKFTSKPDMVDLNLTKEITDELTKQNLYY